MANLTGGRPRRPSAQILLPGGIRQAVLTGVAIGLSVVWLVSPFSPLALGRGDAALGRG
ncbi:MAG: hypothetical protein H0V89_12865, partial [Deltaproteobacteria bacterium]|nr:hypothetical protein [Deltaproteobacteria bacterium]